MTRRHTLRAAMHDLRRTVRRTLTNARRDAATPSPEQHMDLKSNVNMRLSGNVARDGAVTVSSADQPAPTEQAGQADADAARSGSAGDRTHTAAEPP
jgi:hypothetical protein